MTIPINIANNSNIQPLAPEYQSLLADVCAIIDSTRQQLAAADELQDEGDSYDERL